MTKAKNRQRIWWEGRKLVLTKDKCTVSLPPVRQKSNSTSRGYEVTSKILKRATMSLQCAKLAQSARNYFLFLIDIFSASLIRQEPWLAQGKRSNKTTPFSTESDQLISLVKISTFSCWRGMVHILLRSLL